jgi:DNA-binding CsgD family transcriptional regulator
VKMGFADRPSQDVPYKQVLLETLDRIGCGGLVLDSHNNVSATNSVALDIIRRWTDSPLQGDDELAKAVRQLLFAMSSPSTGEDWMTAWQNSEQPLAIFRVPTGEDTVLVLVDLGSRLQPSAKALRGMFGLTSAESNLALGLARGFSPDELAHQIGVRKNTVRSQLAGVFSKTQTHRQGELVALLARLSILP